MRLVRFEVRQEINRFFEHSSLAKRCEDAFVAVDMSQEVGVALSYDVGKPVAIGSTRGRDLEINDADNSIVL